MARSIFSIVKASSWLVAVRAGTPAAARSSLMISHPLLPLAGLRNVVFRLDQAHLSALDRGDIRPGIDILGVPDLRVSSVCRTHAFRNEDVRARVVELFPVVLEKGVAHVQVGTPLVLIEDLVPLTDVPRVHDYRPDEIRWYLVRVGNRPLPIAKADAHRGAPAEPRIQERLVVGRRGDLYRVREVLIRTLQILGAVGWGATIEDRLAHVLPQEAVGEPAPDIGFRGQR